MNRQFIALLAVLLLVVLLTTLVIKKYDPKQPDGVPHNTGSEVYFLLGRAFASREMRDGSGCERLLRRVLELDRNNIYALSMLGGLYLEDGRYALAEPVFARLARIAPDSAAVHANLGVSRAVQKKYPEAISAFEKSLEIDGNSAVVHFHLAAVAAAQRDFARADSELAAAEKLMPRTLLLMPNAPYFDELAAYRSGGSGGENPPPEDE